MFYIIFKGETNLNANFKTLKGLYVVVLLSDLLLYVGMLSSQGYYSNLDLISNVEDIFVFLFFLLLIFKEKIMDISCILEQTKP